MLTGLTLTAVFLADSMCSGPSAQCKQEVAQAVDIFIWLMGIAIGMVAGWNLLMPFFGAGDSVDDQAATITHAGMWFRFIRRVLPTFITFLLVVLILNMAHSAVHSWADSNGASHGSI